jgi:hypothetical protein
MALVDEDEPDARFLSTSERLDARHLDSGVRVRAIVVPADDPDVGDAEVGEAVHAVVDQLEPVRHEESGHAGSLDHGCGNCHLAAIVRNREVVDQVSAVSVESKSVKQIFTDRLYIESDS